MMNLSPPSIEHLGGEADASDSPGKDVGHFLSEAQRLGFLPGMAAKAQEGYLEAEAQGNGQHDFAAVIQPLVTKSGLK